MWTNTGYNTIDSSHWNAVKFQMFTIKYLKFGTVERFDGVSLTKTKYNEHCTAL